MHVRPVSLRGCIDPVVPTFVLVGIQGYLGMSALYITVVVDLSSLVLRHPHLESVGSCALYIIDLHTISDELGWIWWFVVELLQLVPWNQRVIAMPE